MNRIDIRRLGAACVYASGLLLSAVFAQEIAVQKDVAGFEEPRPFNESTYDSFKCMVANTSRDQVNAFLTSSRIKVNDAGLFEIEIADRYDSTARRAFVVDKQVIVFEKELRQPERKDLIVLNPAKQSLSLTFAYALQTGGQQICVKSAFFIDRPTKTEAPPMTPLPR